MRFLVSLLLCLGGGPLALLLPHSPGTCVRAQTLTGRVTDADTGAPLPFASVYVPATKSGAATNAEGYFSVDLGRGRQVVFSYLGYQTQVRDVRGGSLDVQMLSESLDLAEVEILSGGEDRSYAVIRRAIAKADYHRNQLDAYTAEVYIRGTGQVTKVPGLLKLLGGKEAREELEEVTDRPFTSETVSRVSYTRPNTYRQQLLSKLEVGDSDFDANQYFFTSFYDPLVAGEIVSPLHPRAFGYYKFQLEGVFVDRDELVSKIRVIPRSRGEDVFEGVINIVQGDWSIHSLDLTTFKLGFQVDISQQQAEVEDHVWMPVTTTLDASGQIFGLGFEYHYLSTVSDYALTLNQDLGGYVEVIDEKSQTEVAARTAKTRSLSELEERLANGEEVRRKDLRKLMRAYAEQERAESDQPEVVRDVSFVRDSTVRVVTDTASWARLRPVPLSEQEVKAYAIAERRAAEATPEDDRVSADGEGLTVRVGSGSGSEDGQRNKPRRNPHLKQSFFPEPIFNPVEGYVLGGRVSLRNTRKAYEVGLTPRYGFGWRRLTWRADLQLGQSGNGDDADEPRWELSGGRFLRQFDDQPAIEPWLSAYVNLVNGDNFIRLYERAYGQLDYRRSFSDTWRAEATLTYEDRRAVRNNATNNWFGLEDEEEYTPNIPLNGEAGGAVTRVSNAALVGGRVIWRPGLRYRVEDGVKTLLENSAPTLIGSVRAGFPDVGGSRSDFVALEASYQRRFDVGRRGKVDLLVRGGGFVHDAFVDFPDYRHFATSELIITALDPIGSYRLLDWYRHSTARGYVSTFAHYQFRKFLLTQIWQLHLAGLKEDLFVNYLYTPTSDNYTEVGYSLDNIFRFLRVEFVSSFRDFRYDDFGVRISVATSFSSL